VYLPLLEPNAGFYSLCSELDGVFSLGKKNNEVAKLTKVPLVIPNYHQPNRGYALVACTHAATNCFLVVLNQCCEQEVNRGVLVESI